MLELMVVIALVIIFFVAAIENLLPLRGAAERVAHLTTAGSLRSAVGLEATRRVVANSGATGLAEMDGANPTDWLLTPPSNYAGNVTADDYHRVPRGGWGFDVSNRVLFYRIRYPEYIDGAYRSPPGIRYRVVVTRSADGSVRDVGLIQLDAAEWQLSGSEIKRWLERIT